MRPAIALTYLVRELEFSVVAGGLLAGLPFVLAGIADLVGGRLTDHLAATRGLQIARSGLGACAFGTCALLVLASVVASNTVVKALLLAVALATADLALSACWAVCLDVGGHHAGVVTGFMNTAGNLGGLVGPLVFGFAVDRWQSWSIPFLVTAAVYGVGAILWLAIDPHRLLVEPASTS
ncbi:MAG: MFS transporter [Vicinamibacterales bacterium]